MNSNGIILVIEDDKDDRELMNELLDEVLLQNNFKNKVLFLNDGKDALAYLSNIKAKPFMIISDINMPGMNGFDLREVIFKDERLSTLCVPYIFLTTCGYHKDYLEKAYKLSIQGYFKKPHSPYEYRQMLNEILRYWKRSFTPA